MRRLVFLLVSLILVFAACGREGAPQQAGDGAQAGDETVQPTPLAIVATDYKLEGPASVGAGAVSISITNNGQELHQALLYKFNDGQDSAAMIAAAKAEPNSWRSFGQFAGGPVAAPGGGTGNVIVDLKPGRYSFFCEIPDAEGTAHLALGMAYDFEVPEGPADKRPKPPTAEYEASGTEMSYTLPTQWDGTVKFTNVGQQPHELVVVGAAEGKTIDEALAAITAPPGQEVAGPPPYTLLASTSPIGPEKSAWINPDLAPGQYFAICFVGDLTKGGAPHFTQGMQQKFEVK